MKNLTLFIVSSIVVLCNLSNVYSQPTDYVAYYPFSGNANDASGNGKNGSVNGATLIPDRNGVANSAYSFDGTNDYIQLPAVLINNSAFAISFWINVKGDNFSPDNYDCQALIDLRGQYNFVMAYFEERSTTHPGSIQINSTSSSGNKLIYSSNNSISKNIWYHILANFDGTTIRLYINGVEAGNIAQNPPSAVTGHNNVIGKDYVISENRLWYYGSIDEIKIYNRGLTSDEISSLTTEGKAEWTSLDNNLVCKYGKVGIGTSSPQNKLDVNGTIRAKEIKVEAGWADFVFQPSYQLKSLSEVEQFIKTYGHLENIPTASEVEKNGVNVGEIQTKLLQKIEELTLYSIEQNKKLEEQARINALLIEKIEKLEKQVKN